MDGCGSTGNTYNPTTDSNSSQDMDMRLVGDLDYIETGSLGISIIEKSVHDLDLSGINSIIGRAIVLHSENNDDMDSESYDVRVACGVVGTLQA